MFVRVLGDAAMESGANRDVQRILLRLLCGILVLVAGVQVSAGPSGGDEGMLPRIEIARGHAGPDITGTGGIGDHFGYALAVDGNRLLVSAVVERYDLFAPGVVYAFVRMGDAWVQEARLPSHGAGGLGTALAMDGDTALASARGARVQANGTIYTNAGQVLVFERSGASWSERARLNGDRDYGRFGASVRWCAARRGTTRRRVGPGSRGLSAASKAL